MASPAVTSTDNSQSAADIQAAQDVFAQSIKGLEMMSQDLGDAFTSAVDVFAQVKGRVIISGVGKSGHVGRKIAATLASLGTPASFVHAGEASHGDLGMLTAEDAVLAISNSGETKELGDLVAYTRRFSIPLVAITSKGGSSLAQSADIALVLPDIKEACPMGLAPTTSTTLTITLGDALAVALLERHGFTAEDYKLFHPGGKLGQRLFKVSELMHGTEELPVVSAQTSMRDTILVMTEKTFGVAGVTDEAGALVGIVTDGDLRRRLDDDLFQLTAAEVMTASPKVTSPSTLAAEALGFMNASKVGCLFVVDGDKPVGILRLHDCLRAGVA